MRKKLFLVVLLLISFSPLLRAQTNYVPNPGFEDTTSCPSAIDNINYSKTYSSFNSVKNWVSATYRGGPEYYNSCSSLMGVPTNYYGYQPAHGGKAYAGFWAWIDSAVSVSGTAIPKMEYIECKLVNPLVSGKKYSVSFYANLSSVRYAASNFVVGVNSLGIRFSDTLIYSDSAYNLTLTPNVKDLTTYVTDTTNWVYIKGTYIADGSEKYLTLGVFNNTAPGFHMVLTGTHQKVSYVYIDDVNVSVADSVVIDSVVCTNTFPTTLFGDTITGTYKWNTGATTANISISDTGLYWRRAQKDTLYYDDTFRVVRPKTTGFDTIICVNSFPINLHGETAPSGASFSWSDGSTADTLKATAAGVYWRRAYGYGCVDFTDTFDVRQRKTTGNVSTLCINSFPYTISGSSTPGTYLWSNGATTATIKINAASDTGTYWRTTSDTPCVHYTDTIKVKLLQNTGLDTTICSTVLPILLNGTTPYYRSFFSWSTGASTDTITVSTPGTYWRHTVGLPCIDYTDTFKVYRAYTQGIDTTICNPGFPLNLKGSSVSGTYTWNTGATTSSLSVNALGTYWRRTVQPPCTDFTDTFKLKVTPKPQLGNDSEYCFGSSVTLTSDKSYDSYSWSTGDSTRSIQVTNDGEYILIGSDACGSKADSINISFYPKVPLPITHDTVVCQHTQSPTLHVTGTDLLWYETASSGSLTTQPTISTATLGAQTIYVTQTLHNCESDKAPVNITVISKPVVNLGNDTTLCSGQKLSLGSQMDSTKFSWSTGENKCCIVVDKSGKYILNATNVCGTRTDSIDVEVLNCGNCLWTPSAFTPNGDGLNDIFRAKPICPIKSFTMRVFDRWGELVFMSKDMNYGWDGIYQGTPAPPGTYYYSIQYFPDIPNGSSSVIKGDITLIR